MPQRPASVDEGSTKAAPPPLVAVTPAANDNARVILLSNSVRRWRAAGTVFGALAALFAAVIVTSVVRPDLLPPQLRPRETVIEKIVEKVAERPSRFVAVLQRDSVSPAFILTVDLESRTMNVRRVAAETPTGKSYELWLVSSKYPAPRSLGVVGSSEFTAPTALANYPADTVNDATYAISLEPEGGSPTGQVTGPVLWSGKLVEAVPPDAKP
jgi:anti-sigma-K factor RskA